MLHHTNVWGNNALVLTDLYFGLIVVGELEGPRTAVSSGPKPPLFLDPAMARFRLC